jgi:hypothetical protein
MAGLMWVACRGGHPACAHPALGAGRSSLRAGGGPWGVALSVVAAACLAPWLLRPTRERPPLLRRGAWLCLLVSAMAAGVERSDMVD